MQSWGFQSQVTHASIILCMQLTDQPQTWEHSIWKILISRPWAKILQFMVTGVYNTLPRISVTAFL
ncbi:hypothetical protein JZ751_022250 [Albula glossodonta]|uniref:Uncharacterized protein n=1 Tax=Albula glossodonta TaxID=121402 RepID=A0A8T2NHQ6_9TELE|nr:hypothetical protein JZ751_022250 [Albula glossodonta]